MHGQSGETDGGFIRTWQMEIDTGSGGEKLDLWCGKENNKINNRRGRSPSGGRFVLLICLLSTQRTAWTYIQMMFCYHVALNVITSHPVPSQCIRRRSHIHNYPESLGHKSVLALTTYSFLHLFSFTSLMVIVTLGDRVPS